MSFARSNSRQARLRQAARFRVETLERRVLLSSAIAAFGAQQTFAVGSQPRSVAVADLNVDGKPDLVFANAVSNNVSVLLGNGNGTFQNQLTFATGTSPFAVAVADVNGDGKPDLIVANSGSNSVSVLLGNGNGTFQPQVTFAAGSGPRSVAVADLNGDGKPDIVVGNYSSNTVSVLLGTGTGSFSSQQTYATGSQPRSIAIADVNIDGRPDLIVANHGSNSVSVLLNSGTGTFPTQTTFATGTSPFSVTTADVNQDGKPDILVANNGSSSVGVLLNTGTGSFQAQQTFAAGPGPIAIASADVNGDGKPDVVVANYNANTAGVLLGNGDGSFQAQKTFAVGAGPRSIGVADLNRDGRLDLVLGNSSANTTSVLLGDVPPSVLSINRSNPSEPVIAPTTTVTYAVTFSEPVTGVDPTDFSLSLSGLTASTPVQVAGSGASYTVTVNGISGTGTLGLSLVDNESIKGAAGNPLQTSSLMLLGAQQAFPITGTGLSYLSTADLNNDGKPDLVVGGTPASVLLGNGNGTFVMQETLAAGPTPIAIGDVNGDGKQDLVVPNNTSASVSVFLGNGNGTFQGQRTFSAGPYPDSVAIADLNGDGHADIVAANDNSPGTISILLGNGNGTFQPQITAGVGSQPLSVAVSDVNGDGKPDIIVANWNSKYASVLLGNGNGTFQPERTFAVVYPRSIAVADLNGDGNPDLIFASDGRPAEIAVLLGNGNGTFQSAQTYYTGSSVRSINVADMNGDGFADLVFDNYFANAIGVLLGNGDGKFAALQTFAVGLNPTGAAVVDLNRDGRPDVVASSFTSSNVSALLGNPVGSFTGQTYTIPTPPTTTSITRFSPTSPTTAQSTVEFAVAFTGSVSNVLASDFQAITNGGVAVSGPISVSGSGSSYIVTVSGIHGSGTFQLELVDNDTIIQSNGMPLGGTGIGNGSVIGESYTILQTYPTVLSINRNNPAGPGTHATSVSFTVTFSEPVTGVIPSDFALALNGVTAATPVVVSGSGAVYTVNVNSIWGNGTLGLNLVTNPSIRDSNGNPVMNPSQLSFLPQATFAGGGGTGIIASDINGDGNPDVLSTSYYGFVSALLGNGNGTFRAPLTTSVAGSRPFPIAVADVNGDGNPDAIVSTGGVYSQVLLGNGNGSFNTQHSVGTGGVTALAIADLNRDGRSDLIAIHYSAIEIFLGNGNGTFKAQPSLAVGMNPQSVAVADVNGDGLLDLVVTNYQSGTVSVLLGNGNGTFQSQQTFAATANPVSLAVSDVNGDGSPDIIFDDWKASLIGILLGNGNGTFQSLHTLATSTSPRNLVVADLNGDAKPDLLVTTPDYNGFRHDTVSVLLGNGNGTFQAQQTFATGQQPRGVAVADVSSDGRSDVIVTTLGDNNIGILLNNSGNFTGQVYNISTIPAVLSITRMSPQGLNASTSSVTFAVNFNMPVSGVAASDFNAVPGGATAVAGPVTVSGSGASYTVTVSGIHGNGTLELDLIDNDSITDGVGTPLGDVGTGNGSFTGQSYAILQTYPMVLSINRANPIGFTTSAASVSYTVTFSEPVTGVDPTDFSLALNGVTAATPVVVGGSGAVYTVTVNGISGAGTLGLNLVDNGNIRDAAGNPLVGAAPAFQPPQTTLGSTHSAIAQADFNGDGITDVVVDSTTGYSTQVLLGNGNGTFQPLAPIIVSGIPRGLTAVDVNGDGRPDFVVTDSSTRRVGVLLGNGDGTFQPERTFAVGFEPIAVAVADVNGDGKPDLAVVNQNDSNVSVLLGNGNGTFQSQRTFPAFEDPNSVAVADVNGDGIPDLIVSNPVNATTSVLLGNGDGTFRTEQLPSLGTTSEWDVAVGDFNADGSADLVVASNPIAVFLGNGNGTFGPAQTYATTQQYGAYSVAVADVNGDGKLDIVETGQLDNSVEVLLGNGNGTFQAPQVVATSTSQPRGFVIADLNGDGRPDLAIADSQHALDVELNSPTGDFTGQTYAILPVLDTINGTSGNDTITLTRNIDGNDIDWTLGMTGGQFPANDPNGLTINGNGGNDTITLDYTNGNPLPNIMHLNSGTGNFTINGLQGTNPLAGTALDIAKSTLFISYSSSDPIATIQSYLKNGYNSGAWNGSPTATTGVITSAAAQANANHNTAIGYADAADGQGINTTPNTIELKYTLYGDANLDAQVNSADLQRLLAFFNNGGGWDQGDFNYDGIVNSADLQALLFTFNTQLGSQATPMAIAAAPAAPAAPATNTSSDPSPQLMPAIRATGSSDPVVHHLHPAKVVAKKRR
jgi:hypothetical protein